MGTPDESATMSATFSSNSSAFSSRMDSVDAIFGAIKAGVEQFGPDLVKQMKASVVYDVEGRQLTLDLKSGNGSASDGQTIAKPDLVISMDSATLLDLAQGKLQPQQAFMKGKLKLKGSMPVAMKVQKVMDAARKAATEVQPTPSGASSVPATPRGGATSTATSAGSAASASSELAAAGPVLKSRAVFDAIGLAVKNDGASLVKKVNGVIQFVICEGSPSGRVLATHLLDLKTGTGSLRQLPSSSSSSSQAASGTAAASPKPDLTLTLSDDDMHLLAGGKLNPQNAFMKGRLKIKGNMGLAMKLGSVIDAAKKGPTAKL